MLHQDWHVDLLEILREVRLREGHDAVVVSLGPTHHALAPPVPDHALCGLRTGTVEAVERSGRDVVVELRSVRGDLRLKVVEHLLRQSPGIGRRLHHQRRHGADDDRLGHAAFAVAREVVHHFAAPRRVPDMDCVLEVEMGGQLRQIVGIMIHVMTVADLAGTAMASTAVGDDATTGRPSDSAPRLPRRLNGNDQGSWGGSCLAVIVTRTLLVSGRLRAQREGHMPTALPTLLATYFAATNSHDVHTMIALFSDTAV